MDVDMVSEEAEECTDASPKSADEVETSLLPSSTDPLAETPLHSAGPTSETSAGSLDDPRLLKGSLMMVKGGLLLTRAALLSPAKEHGAIAVNGRSAQQNSLDIEQGLSAIDRLLQEAGISMDFSQAPESSHIAPPPAGMEAYSRDRTASEAVAPPHRVYQHQESELTRQIDALFAKWDSPESPGCALAFLQEGEIIYSRGYGMGNLDYKMPLTTYSSFNIASVGNQFIALTLLLLAQEGLISLDDSVRDYLPELPDYCSPVTLRHFLLHTSGIRDEWDMVAFSATRQNMMHNAEGNLKFTVNPTPQVCLPGEQFTYLCSAYTLLGLVIGRVTGTRLQKYLEDRLFSPLGMRHTRFYCDSLTTIPNRAFPYSEILNGKHRLEQINFDSDWWSGFFSTLEDMERWDANLYTKRIGGEVLPMMELPGLLNDGRHTPSCFGQFLRDHKGLNLLEHGGTCGSYRTHYLRSPDLQFSILILANLDTIKPGPLALRVTNLVLHHNRLQGKHIFV